MKCSDCGEELERPHYHGDEDHTTALRYGKMKAGMERDWIRELVARTHAQVDEEIATENYAIRRLEDGIGFK